MEGRLQSSSVQRRDFGGKQQRESLYSRTPYQLEAPAETNIMTTGTKVSSLDLLS